MRYLVTSTLLGAFMSGAALAAVILDQPYDGTSPGYWAQEYPDWPELSIWEFDDLHTQQGFLVETLTVFGFDSGDPDLVEEVKGEIWDGLPGSFGGAVVMTSVSGTYHGDGTLTISFGGQELPAGDYWITGWVKRVTTGFDESWFWYATTPVADSEAYAWNPSGFFWSPDPLPASEAYDAPPRDLALMLEGTPTGLLGDLNCDGVVNAFDIDPFVLALTSAPDFEAYYAAYPDCDPMLADINGDGEVNGFDIDPFVELLIGG